MKKSEFLKICDLALKENKGIIVKLEMPGNKNKEEVYNHPEDVYNKKNYYDQIYDNDMHHLRAPVKIIDISMK